MKELHWRKRNVIPFTHNFISEKSAIVISVYFKLHENGNGNRSQVCS